jgi:hypothetical protein
MPEELVPGFYQGPQRQRGLKTGRVAPRDAVRPTAWAEIQNDNHLQPHHPNQVWSETSDQYDPNQGALFDVSKVAPRNTPPLAGRAPALGVPSGRISVKGKDTMGLAAQPGFMPNLSTKQKLSAIQATANARDATGNGTATPFADIMRSRESAYSAKGHADWYAGTDASGRHDGSIGHAPAMIQQTAGVHGFTTGAMTRAVAQTSPQAGWQDENSGEFHNLNGAKQALQAVPRGTDSTEEAVRHSGSSLRLNGGVLPENTGKAAVHFFRHGGKGGAYDVQSPLSQKAPNFEASLHLSHVDPTVRQMAAQAYTVDRHDARIAGMDGNSKEFQRRGVYDAVAMTGRRAALKHRQLPPNEQAAEWVGQKSRSYNPGAGDAPRLFDPDNPPKGNHTTSRVQQRSAIAEKYDLEF